MNGDPKGKSVPNEVAQLQAEVARLRQAQAKLIDACEHTIKVFESMADRGRYPQELLPTGVNPELFLGRQGYHYLFEAVEQAKAS